MVKNTNGNGNAFSCIANEEYRDKIIAVQLIQIPLLH